MSRRWITPEQFREKARQIAEYSGADEEEHELMFERFHVLVEDEIGTGSPYGPEIAEIHASVCSIFCEHRYD